MHKILKDALKFNNKHKVHETIVSKVLLQKNIRTEQLLIILKSREVELK